MADITDILTKLLERTNQDKVSWQTTADDDTFIAVFGNVSVAISTYGQWGETMRLTILNKEGRVIERLDNDTAEGQQWESELAELHTKAKRIALGVDSQLNDLLKALDSDP